MVHDFFHQQYHCWSGRRDKLWHHLYIVLPFLPESCFFFEKLVNITIPNRIVTPFKYCHIFHWIMCDCWRESKQFQTSNTLTCYMDVSENSGTPKSSVLIGFSIINHPFWGIPIFGNSHMTPHQKTVETAVLAVGRFPPAHQVQPQNFPLDRAGHWKLKCPGHLAPISGVITLLTTGFWAHFVVAHFHFGAGYYI